MKTVDKKTTLSAIILLGVVSLVVLFSIDFTQANNAGLTPAGKEHNFLPDIQFIKHSIDQLVEIFKLF